MPEAETALVLRVVDGDTFIIKTATGSASVRIIGIDTPEKNEEGFTEAAERLRSIIEGQEVTLYRSPAENADMYGRLLRYVHREGEDVGLNLLREGYAAEYPWFAHPRREEYGEAVQ